MSEHPKHSADPDQRAYPGAAAPSRTRVVDTHGVRLAVHEWGNADDPPLLLAHGGADFARTFDAFAPLLAAGGWRVVVWDHRGHGDSEHAALYSWEADIRDALAVLDATSAAPLPVVGHSKGGGLLSHLVASLPDRFTAFVNIDGIPGKRQSPSRGMSMEARVDGRAKMLAYWLDRRRRAHRADRKPGSIAELAGRRGRYNPRLSTEWLEYLVTVGAVRHPDGWRWKLDPTIRMGLFGPWRPEWGLRGLAAIEVPMLVILGAQEEPMGWGTDPEKVRGQIPGGAELDVLHDSGHFVHIEHPQRTASRVLDFLGSPKR